MLYLEDYLEMIENLPMEMTDKFTEMREMDLQVSNAMDSLEEKLKAFFKKCSSTPGLKVEWRDEQMAKIKQEYQKALEDADEKVQLANQIYELVERHLRKLDQEVAKFKMELEADNAGITEILEKRVAEADRQAVLVNNHRPEKRKYSSMISGGSNDVGLRPPTSSSVDRLHQSASLPSSSTASSSDVPPPMQREVVCRSLAGSAAPMPTMFETVQKTQQQQQQQPVMSYNLGQVGSGSNAAIAVAASRAIGATLEMQQGRRTASLKASYEAVSKSVELTKELALGRAGSSANEHSATSRSGLQAANTVENTSTTTTKSAGRSSKKSGVRASAAAAAAAHHQQQLLQQQLQSMAPTVQDLAPPLEPLEIAGGADDGVQAAWQPDPNEPRYCICNDVSYGEMVGCDNEDCPIEWFHYGCVGVTQAPRGKWYCPQCLAAMKRRGRK